MGYFASVVKTTWSFDISSVRRAFEKVLASAYRSFEYHGIPEQPDLFSPLSHGELVQEETQLTPGQIELLLKNSISPSPLRRVLLLKECISLAEDPPIRDFLLLGLANLVVKTAGNVAFGPEVYVKKPKEDVHVLEPFSFVINQMMNDLESLPKRSGRTAILQGDAREIGALLKGYRGKVDHVITSPPYPNEKDYTRSTRLESVLLGYISGKRHLRQLKESLLRSNSRNVFAADRDSKYIERFQSITRLAKEIEAKRIELNKTSGFERVYHNVVLHYFGGMYRHFLSLKPILAPGAELAYVVGDQMSFLRAHIRTAHLLAELVDDLGYRVKSIERWRARQATATKMQIDENVLIFRN